MKDFVKIASISILTKQVLPTVLNILAIPNSTNRYQVYLKSKIGDFLASLVVSKTQVCELIKTAAAC